jgi:tetratricopeptide (TPR) repeat protein
MISASAVFGALLLMQTPAPAPLPPHPAIATGDSAYAMRKWSDALTAYETAAAAQPTNLQAHIKAGYSAVNANSLVKAREHFRAIVAAVPPTGGANAKAGLAVVLAREGKAAAALAMLDTALAAGYPNWEVLDNEKAFDPVRKDPRFKKVRDSAEVLASPCMADANARAFDFWVGEWDVYVNGTGQKAGENRIDRTAGGCLILENWTATSGYLVGPPSSGTSMNFVERSTGMWKQVWMGSGRGQTNYENGKYADGIMRFLFTRTNPQGQAVTIRFSFHNLGANRVRQHQEASADSGKTFTTNYDFIYVRKGSGEKP